MNEQIVKLITEADAYACTIAEKYVPECGEVSYLWEDTFRKKFAELIVGECAQVCLAQRDPGNLNYKPSVKFAEAVKQHFGVK